MAEVKITIEVVEVMITLEVVEVKITIEAEEMLDIKTIELKSFMKRVKISHMKLVLDSLKLKNIKVMM